MSVCRYATYFQPNITSNADHVAIHNLAAANEGRKDKRNGHELCPRFREADLYYALFGRVYRFRISRLIQHPRRLLFLRILRHQTIVLPHSESAPS